MRDRRLKPWEGILIAFSIVLFGAAFFAYVTNYSLRHYFFEDQSESAKVRVGILGPKVGTLRRQFNGEQDFRSIDSRTPLYNYDTLVTPSDGSATVLLDDGSKIELGPETMIRLSFENHLTLSGISRSAAVNVVSGVVTAQSPSHAVIFRARGVRVADLKAGRQLKVDRLTSRFSVAPVAARPSPLPVMAVAHPSPRPSPSPSPTQPPGEKGRLVLLAPKPSAQLALDPRSPGLEMGVNFEWQISRPRVKAVLLVIRPDGAKPGKDSPFLLKQRIEMKKDHGNFTWIARAPGKYEWEIRSYRDVPFASAPKTVPSFTVLPEKKSLVVLDPLVAGQVLKTNLLKGRLTKDFRITFRWVPVEGASHYVIWIATRDLSSPAAKHAKPLLQKFQKETQITFKPDQVYRGSLYYQITALHAAGWRVISPVTRFSFDFLPPLLVLPEDKATYELSKMKKDDNSILFTWQKTNFTLAYEFQLARDPNFQQIVLKKALLENYYVLKKPIPGHYWWRARSYTRKISSPMSRPNEVFVTP